VIFILGVISRKCRRRRNRTPGPGPENGALHAHDDIIYGRKYGWR